MRISDCSSDVCSSDLALKGFSANLTYFRINYRNRVASPLSPVTAAFDPKFADFVQVRPSAADVLAAIEGVTGTFSNNSGQGFNPAAVTAILDDRLRNISLQSLHGVDLAVNYAEDMGRLGSLSLNASASYLNSNRQVTDGQPSFRSKELRVGKESVSTCR